ncbi:cilia- and flagella-associated protein 251-like [Papaver somniferum]|uniref:cilia- and flagella-associated protein 251-like n=1 Tax=Papaver somniferum TaxID=3469 RepID=UPI000E703105|nr:cilia- and flagella-associated protein 251-like [Papaver somniferum]
MKSLLASLKKKKIHAADLSNVQNDKDIEEESEKGEKSGKGGDVDDNDDDDEEEEEEEGEKGKKGGDLHDDRDDDDEEKEDEEEEGGKGGDLHDDENGKVCNKGGEEEDRTESQQNEVPSETPKKLRPLSKSNEEEDGKDGPSLRVESETANKQSTSLPKTNEYQQDQMDLDNHDVRNTTQTAEIDEATQPRGRIREEDTSEDKSREDEGSRDVEDMICEIMSPTAGYYVKNNIISEVQNLVVDFMRDMPGNLEVLVILVNHSTLQIAVGVHWSLLKFDFEDE